MSIGFIDRVWKSDLADIYELSVLLALADHADKDGRCYPSVPNVAKKARCSVRKAQEVIRALSERGYLTVEPNTGPKGCNTYFLTLNSAQDAPPHGAHPRIPRQEPQHATTPTPAQHAPEPSKKHKRTRASARASDLPKEWQSDAAKVKERFARAIRAGKATLARHCPVPMAHELIAAKAVTPDQCRAVGLAI